MSTLYTATTVAYYLIPALLLRRRSRLEVPHHGYIHHVSTGYMVFTLDWGRCIGSYRSPLAALWHLCREVR
jgi:hypothetical protein